MNKLSVSLLHLCQRCPRLAAYGSHGEQAAAWRVGLAGSGDTPGRIFHEEIARPLFNALSKGESSPIFQELTALRTALGLYATVQEHLLHPLLQRLGNTLTLEQIRRLDQGCTILAEMLTDFLGRTGSRKNSRRKVALVDCFHPPEQEITAVFPLSDQLRVQITGRLDALLLDPIRQEALIVEFKGRKASQPDEDFLQLLLYAWLVREKTGITPGGQLLYLEETPPTVGYTSHQLAASFANLTPLVATAWECQTARPGHHRLGVPGESTLCQACPFAHRCDADWGNRTPVQPVVVVDEEDQWLANTQSLLLNTLAQLKISVVNQGWIVGPRFVRFRLGLDLQGGASMSKILTKSRELQIALKLDAPPLIQAQAGFVGVDLPRRHLRPVTLTQLLERGVRNRPNSPVAFPLGLDVNGEVFWVNLAEPTMTNLLVGGMAGSGKTVFLLSCAAALMRLSSPEEVRLVMIDPKRVSFAALNGLPHLLTPPILETEEALCQLDVLVEEMEQRYRLFQAAGVVDITGYPLPHLVIFIDEYADMMVDKKLKPRLETAVQRIGQKGRAAGLHLILATQRPEARVITPLIKANLHLKVAMQVGSGKNSLIILDEVGAENLLGHGDMLVAGTIRPIRLQGALAGREDFKAKVYA